MRASSPVLALNETTRRASTRAASRARVPAWACDLVEQAEAAEAGQEDFLARLERVRHGTEEQVHEFRGLAVRDAGLLDEAFGEPVAGRTAMQLRSLAAIGAV